MKIKCVLSTVWVGAVFVALPCVAQVPARFSFGQSASGPSPLNIHSIDVNNDGIPDIVQNGGAGFAVSLGKGDGTFRPAVQYNLPVNSATRFVPGDFNGDGKVDLMFASPGTTQVFFAAGNGDGTFKPVRADNVPLVAAEIFTSNLPVLAGDFNHDGNLDLVVGATGPPFDPVYPDYQIGPQALYLLEGNGTGGFSAAISIYAVPENTQIDSYAAGDFDGDDNADVVVSVRPVWNPFVGPSGPWYVSVLYGTGTSSFEEYPLFSSESYTLAPTLGTGDVNSDGRSDIFFIEGATDELYVYMGSRKREFTLATSPTPSLSELQYDSLIPSEFALADFNDDGRMDLVAYAYNIIDIGTGNVTSNLLVMLGAGAPGTFKYQVVPLPAYYSQVSRTVVGDFNRDTKPDVLVGMSDFDKQPILLASTNVATGQLWSNCGYPMGAQLIHLCSPVAYSDGRVSFDATASSLGLLRKMELWLDGKKIAEQYNAWENRAWLNFSASATPGKHRAVLFADDIDHTLKRLAFNFTVGDDGCTQPASPGVRICKPLGGSAVGRPTTVQAEGRVAGTLARMEIWVDGVKQFTQTTSASVNAAVGLTPGSHRFVVLAVNTAGTVWRGEATATVK